MTIKPAGLMLLLLILAGFPVFGQQFDTIYRNESSYGLSDLVNYKENFILNQLYDDYQEVDNDYFIVRLNGKYGVYNASKNIIFAEPKYDTITTYGNFRLDGKPGNIIYTEEISTLILEHPRGIVFIKDGKYGLKKVSGETLLKAEYEEIVPKQYGLFFVKKKGRWGFINADRDKSFVKPKHDFLIQYTDFDTQYPRIFAYDNKVKTPYSIYGEPAGKEKKPGKQKHSPKRYTEFTKNYWFGGWEPKTMFFTSGKKNGVKDAFGNIIIAAKYDMINPMMDGNYLVSKDTLYGMLGSKGQIIIPVVYGGIGPVKGDALKDNLFYVYKQNLSSIFDAKGTQLYPFEMLYSEGAMPMDEDYKKIYFQVVENKILEKGKEIDEYGDPQPSNDIYSKALLLYENGQITKVLGNCTDIKYIDYSADYILAYTPYGSYNYGFYNQRTGKKTDAVYKHYLPVGGGRIVAGKGEYYDTILDSSMVESRLPALVTGYSNGYYLVEDNGQMRVMDQNYNIFGFGYPKLEFLVDFKQSALINPVLEAAYSKVFKFFDASGKCGLIDIDGKVLFPAGEYDELTIALRNLDQPYPGPQKAEVINRYADRIMVAKKYAGNTTETDLYFEGEKIANFSIYKQWQLKYNDITANNQLILRDPHIQVYNLATQKTDLETTADNFSEDEDGGFTTVYGYTAHRIEKYSTSGKLLSVDSIPNAKLYGYKKSKPQYIHKKNGKYGLVNVKGEMLSPFVNDTLYTYDYNYYVATRGNKTGIITKDEIVMPLEYDSIAYKPYNWMNIEKGVFVLYKNGKYGMADKEAKMLLPAAYDSLFARGELIIANTEKAFSVFDRSGKPLFNMVCDKLEPYTMEMLYFEQNDKKGIVRKDGRIMMQPLYDHLEQITEKIYLATNGGPKYLVSQIGDKLLEIPVQSARRIVSEYSIFDSTEDFLAIQNTSGKYALYSLTIKELLPFEYDVIDKVENFRYAIVEKNRLMGVVTVDNKSVIPVIYKYINFNDEYGCFEAETNKARYLISPDGIILQEEPND